MTLLNFNATKNNSINTVPFSWGIIDNIFCSSEKAEKFHSIFPQKGFDHVEKSDSFKKYSMYNLEVVINNKIISEKINLINSEWKKLIYDILSGEYKKMMEEYSGISLDNTSIDIIFWKYDNGCWLDSHLDKESKILTHILYFNKSWNKNHGGNLLILNSDNIEDVYETVPPILNTSGVICRGDNSWHAVEKVTESNLIERQSLQIIFHK